MYGVFLVVPCVALVSAIACMHTYAHFRIINVFLISITTVRASTASLATQPRGSGVGGVLLLRLLLSPPRSSHESGQSAPRVLRRREPPGQVEGDAAGVG
jgi:hypothetical protein